MENESGVKIKELKVDGGITKNSFIMQFQSNLLQKNIVKSEIPDTTSLGVTFAAMRSLGLWKTIDDLGALINIDKVFKPEVEKVDLFKSYYEKWKDALNRTLSWKK